MKRILLLIVGTLTLTSWAQTPLTLEACLDLALEHNRRLASTHYALSSARYERQGAFAHFLPQISLTGIGLYSDAHGGLDIAGGLLPVVGADGTPTGTGAYFPGIQLDYAVDWVYGAGIRVEQPLFAGGKIVSGYRMAQMGESIALQQRRLTESEVLVETAQAYAALLRATEMCKVATAHHGLLTELHRSVETAVRHGVKSRNDLLKVEVKLNESELNLRRVENAGRLATMNLCHYIGLPLHDTLRVSSQLPDIPADLTHPADVSLRPEARMLAGQSEVMRLKMNMSRADLLPQVGVMGQYGYMHGLEVAGSHLFDKSGFAVGVRLSVPIVHLSTYAKYRSAKMQYRQARSEEEDKLELMTLELTRTLNNVDEAGLELQLAEKGIESATENLRVSKSQYDQGVETLTDHLTAHTLWLEAEQMLIEARIHRFLCWIEYQKVSGSLAP